MGSQGLKVSPTCLIISPSLSTVCRHNKLPARPNEMRAHLQTISGETTRQPANPSYPCCGIPFLSSRQSGDLQSSGMGALPCIPVSPSPVFEGLPPTIVHRPQSQNTALISQLFGGPRQSSYSGSFKTFDWSKACGQDQRRALHHINWWDVWGAFTQTWL